MVERRRIGQKNSPKRKKIDIKKAEIGSKKSKNSPKRKKIIQRRAKNGILGRVQPKMDPAVKAKWIKALRSGKYTQARVPPDCVAMSLRSHLGNWGVMGVLEDLYRRSLPKEIRPKWEINGPQDWQVMWVRYEDYKHMVLISDRCAKWAGLHPGSAPWVIIDECDHPSIGKSPTARLLLKQGHSSASVCELSADKVPFEVLADLIERSL